MSHYDPRDSNRRDRSRDRSRERGDNRGRGGNDYSGGGYGGPPRGRSPPRGGGYPDNRGGHSSYGPPQTSYGPPSGQSFYGGGDKGGFNDGNRHGGDRRGDDRGGGDRYGGGGGGRGGGGDRGGDRGGSSYGGGGYGGGRGGGGGGGYGGGGGGGRGGGYGGGGGGGGGRGGGFGGGRGGRGGGKNRHMGEVDSILSLLRDDHVMGDSACLRIIDPPLEDRFRDMLITDQATGEKHFMMPAMEPWRVEARVGANVENVRSNYFRVNPADLVANLYHYNVAIFHKNDFARASQNAPSPYGPLHSISSGSGSASASAAGDTASTGSGSRKSKNVVKDYAKEKDAQLNYQILLKFAEMHIDHVGGPTKAMKIGRTYDGKSSLYTSAELSHLSFDDNGNFHSLVPLIPGETERKAFMVIISLVGTISVPRTTSEWLQSGVNETVTLQGLNIALPAFARWAQAMQNPSWLISGSKVFATDGVTFNLSDLHLARLGYHASLRATCSGLALVTEVSVSCFLKGGPLLEVMAHVGRFRSVEDLLNSGQLEDPRCMQRILAELKGVRIKLKHVGQTKKLKSFGPSSDDPSGAFVVEDKTDGGESRKMTVAEYYSMMAAKDSRYAACLPGGRLRFPKAPTVNVGTKQRAIFIPCELLVVAEGQIRNNTPTEIAAKLIQHAAMKPNDRFKFLQEDSETQRGGLFGSMRQDSDVAQFGLNTFSSKAMNVHATLLPPPKLQYGNGRIVDPGLKGSWNLAGNVQFVVPPVAASGTTSHHGGHQKTLYGLVTVYARSRPLNIDGAIDDFVRTLERESVVVGAPMTLIDRPEYCEGNDRALQQVMQHFKASGARIVVVILHVDEYGAVKLAADRLQLPTQCVKFQKLSQPPKNYHSSLLVKMNYKLGGINHTLASRAQNSRGMPVKCFEDEDEAVFQSPPKSISWLFDEPCMVMGVDVNHPEVGQSGDSVAAVVASMDGMLGQYAAYVTTCASRTEPVTNLQEATSGLLDAFCRRNNGKMPVRIIIYRDGVADNQFQQVLESEIAAYKEAIMLRGYLPEDVQIAVIMCQKRHSARLVYEERGHGESKEYINPCVGLVVDSRDFLQKDGKGGISIGAAGKSSGSRSGEIEEKGSMNTPNVNEFYLNSHAAVLGTSKPCKYVLIYDEIGLKLTEIELLTFWTTHLYARCTRSVSYATPAYYAHWAARRGKVLLDAGASLKELQSLSESWLQEKTPSMFFA